MPYCVSILCYISFFLFFPLPYLPVSFSQAMSPSILGWNTSSLSSELRVVWEGGGVGGRQGTREVVCRLPLQFQERMQLIMIRDVPGKGQLKLQQA